jgi:hypothetical protein
MVGAITSWDVFAHPVSTIQCFGWRVFFRAVLPSSRREQTFLGLLQDAGFFRETGSEVSAILDRCIDLEIRAKHVYAAFAKRFAEQGLPGPFFAGLAEQEQYHADLLQVCRSAALRGNWRANLFNPWQDYLPRLQQQMDAVEADARRIDSLEDALRLTIRIESSEVNQVFAGALAASDAAFVHKLRPFREAMEAHMIYLAERIPELAPELMLDCREMRMKFPRVCR